MKCLKLQKSGLFYHGKDHREALRVCAHHNICLTAVVNEFIPLNNLWILPILAFLCPSAFATCHLNLKTHNNTL